MSIHEEAVAAFRYVYDQELRHKEELIAEKDQSLQEISTQLQAISGANQRLTAEVESKTAEVIRLEGEKEELLSEIETLKNRIKELEQSEPTPAPIPVAGVTESVFAAPANAKVVTPSTIQSAISSAADGDTLVLRGGEYPPKLNIQKRLTLQPAAGEKAVFDGRGASTHVLVAKAPLNIRGLQFKNFNTPDGNKFEHGLLFPEGSSGSLIEFCTFEDFKGVSAKVSRAPIFRYNKGSMTIRNCEFYRSDQGHLAGNALKGLVVENNLFSESNQVVGPRDTSGGMKFTRVEDAAIQNNIIENVNGQVAAIWFDVYCVGGKILNNVIRNAGKSYVFIELCHDFVVANNRTEGTTQFAIWPFDSSSVRIWNNEVVGGTSWQIGIMQDNRRNDGSEGDARANGVSRNVEAVNNILGSDYNLFQLYAMDEYKTYTPESRAEDMYSRIEGNRMPKGTRGAQVGWGRLNRQRDSLSLEQLEAGYPQVARNNNMDKPVGLPADIAKMLGVPAGTAKVGPILPAPVRANPA